MCPNPSPTLRLGQNQESKSTIYAYVMQVQLEHRNLEWTVHNAWFVRQLNFRAVFRKRDIVQPAATWHSPR